MCKRTVLSRDEAEERDVEEASEDADNQESSTPKPNQQESIRERLLSAAPSRREVLVRGLAATVGVANVLCLLLYRTFGTMMTGNTIFLAQALVNGAWADAGFYASTIGAFCLGQMAFKVVDYRCRKRLSATRLAAPCLVLTIVQDVCAPYGGRWLVIPLSCVLGVVTAVSNDYDGIVCNMVTGHIQKLTNIAFASCLGDLPDALRRQRRASALIVASFALGVGAGTLAVAKGFAHFSPLGASFAFLLVLHDRHVAQLRARAATPKALARCLSRNFLHLSGKVVGGAKALAHSASHPILRFAPVESHNWRSRHVTPQCGQPPARVAFFEGGKNHQLTSTTTEDQDYRHLDSIASSGGTATDQDNDQTRRPDLEQQQPLEF